jgi:predicted amidohydrolase
MQPLTLTIIQTNLFWEDKIANLNMLQQKIDNINEKTEVVILPEMFSTGFSMKPENLAETMEGNTIQWMKEVASKNRIILTGSLIIKENGNYYNRLIWMLPNGQFGKYDKRHLFAFAGEHEHYSPGKKRLVASVKGWKINLQICYDLRFPVWARQNPGENELKYDVLINVANWPQKRNTAWNSLLKARAIENQCFVVGVNRVGEDGNRNIYLGDSQIIDPLGEVLFHQSMNETVATYTLSKATIAKVRDEFPFLNDADNFFIND